MASCNDEANPAGGECGTFGELDPDLLCDRRTRDQY